MEELTALLSNSVEYVIHNAQGSPAQAQALAGQMHTQKEYAAFFAIATPATQALSTVEKKRPIILAAVTNPLALGVMHSTTNVCGITDMVNIPATIRMVTNLFPRAKKIGLIYTSGETNSLILVKKLHEELALQKLTPLEFAINNESDIHAIMEKAYRESDVILVSTDNTLASAILLVASIALKHKKPLLTTFITALEGGALAARGVDYTLSGKEAARITYSVLKDGKKTYKIPLLPGEGTAIYLNKKTLTNLGITLSESLKDIMISK